MGHNLGALVSRRVFESGRTLFIGEFGGAERDRTAGLLVANEALSQLSYSPTTSLSYQPAANPERAALGTFSFGRDSLRVKGQRAQKGPTADSCSPGTPRCCGPFRGG
jgi:hypothetical protein